MRRPRHCSPFAQSTRSATAAAAYNVDIERRVVLMRPSNVSRRGLSRCETLSNGGALMLGPVSDLGCRNCWTLVERARHPSPDRLQQLLTRAEWDAQGVVADLRARSAIIWAFPARGSNADTDIAGRVGTGFGCPDDRRSPRCQQATRAVADDEVRAGQGRTLLGRHLVDIELPVEACVKWWWTNSRGPGGAANPPRSAPSPSTVPDVQRSGSFSG